MFAILEIAFFTKLEFMEENGGNGDDFIAFSNQKRLRIPLFC